MEVVVAVVVVVVSVVLGLVVVAVVVVAVIAAVVCVVVAAIVVMVVVAVAVAVPSRDSRVCSLAHVAHESCQIKLHDKSSAKKSCVNDQRCRKRSQNQSLHTKLPSLGNVRLWITRRQGPNMY